MLTKECHWLNSMSAKVCVLCTICLGKREITHPCIRHDEKIACQRHDCAHYIPLNASVLCCEPGRLLPLDLLKPWIDQVSEVLVGPRVAEAHD